MFEKGKIVQIVPANGTWKAVYATGVQGKPYVTRQVACWVLMEYEDGFQQVVGMDAGESGLVVCEEAVNFLGYTEGHGSEFERAATEYLSKEVKRIVA